VRISGTNAGYTMFRGSVKSTGYPLNSPVSPFISPPVRHRVPSHFSWTLAATVAVTDQSLSPFFYSLSHVVLSASCFLIRRRRLVTHTVIVITGLLFVNMLTLQT